MVRFTVWLQLLLVVLILRQSAAVSDQVIELQEEISRLERDLIKIVELKNEIDLRASNTQVSSYTKICSIC
jgi:Tfp pilus assembly protein PilN